MLNWESLLAILLIKFTVEIKTRDHLYKKVPIYYLSCFSLLFTFTLHNHTMQYIYRTYTIN